MKKNLLPAFILSLSFFCSLFSKAQTISVVPNPSQPDIFAYTSGALSGYAGNAIAFNNKLVLEYNPTGVSDVTAITLQLALYTPGTNSLTLIANPDAGQGVYFQSVQVVFNNKLFFIYLDASAKQRLASFDGTSITLYPNPDAGLGYIGSPRILNNNLYVAYSNAAGATQFGEFNGTGITLIPNPDASATGFYNDYAVVFNGKLVSRYVTAAGPKQLATFDGTSWTLFPNPDNTTRGVYPDFPAIYNNKIYWMYFSAANQYQYIQFDGTNNPTLIANPEDGSANQGGVVGFPIVFNDTLFYQYYNAANVLQLGKFGGTTMSLVPNPDATTFGYYNTPIVYNNNLYIFYVTPDGLHHLTQYQSASNSLKVYSNPDAGNGYWDQPVVYDNNLFFMYYNQSGVFQLGYFDGTSIKLITNPSGIYNGAAGENGYVGSPLVYNNLLYMQFGGVPYGDAGNLAYFDGSSLPVSLLSFTAQKQSNTTLLQWKTANEVGNKYFSIERSSDAIHFSSIGQVEGMGSVAVQHQYSFTDKTPVKGMNYYRLKQVDNNGNFTYSSVAKVSFTSVVPFSIYPNPAVNTISLTLPESLAASVVDVFDMSGKKVMEKQMNANVVSETLDVSKLPAGTYKLALIQQGAQVQTVNMFKQ